MSASIIELTSLTKRFRKVAALHQLIDISTPLPSGTAQISNSESLPTEYYSVEIPVLAKPTK